MRHALVRTAIDQKLGYIRFPYHNRERRQAAWPMGYDWFLDNGHVATGV